jgi:hypothetical protein
VGFQHITDTVDGAVKPKREQEGGEHESEIQTAMRMSLNISQKTSDHYKLCQLCKNNISNS